MSQQRAQQFAYDGKEGQTRRETIHVPRPGGGLATAQVYRVINVATDPRLRPLALEGTLHRLDSGERLACTFVYHDPGRFHFVVVVPQELAHRTLSERAALLQRIADDTAHRVPPYVERAEVVVGAQGLQAWLDAPEPVDTSDAEKKLAERESSLLEREARLKARAEATTSREDDLRLEGLRVEALRRELEMKEAELEARFDSLREREAALAELPGETTSSGTFTGESTAAQAGDLASEVMMVDEPSLADSVEAIDDDEVDAADVQTLDDVAEELDPADVEALDAEELEELDDDEVLDADDVMELDEEADLIEEETAQELDPEELEAAVLSEEVAEDVGEPTTVHQSEAPRALDQRIATAATPPDHFFTDTQVEMVAEPTESEVWLFARLSEGHEDAFRSDGVELMVQYLVVESYPVVLLTLVEWSDPRPYVRRAALDPKADKDLALLERLRDDLSATVAIFGPEGRFERTLEVSSPERRTNLATALERAGRTEGDGDPATAMERALAAPPPVKLRGHPFEDAPPAEDAKQAFAAVAALTKWSAPAKLDMAVLALSIPRDVVDDSFRRILTDAITHGISLPPALVSRAVSLGVAPEPGELVLRLIDAFRGTSGLPAHGGLAAEVVARNWEQLLEAASEHEVSLTSEIHDAAWKAIAEVRGGGGPIDVDPATLPDKTIDELIELLEHPKVRKEAALEMLTRGDPELLPSVYKAVRKMPRDEVLQIVPRIVAYGEAGADALIDGLNARKTFVRQASALALGELQLRRSIAPLVQLLQTEPTEVWWEVGRVIGSFGSSALRTLTRAMKDPKGLEERFAYTLAHLSNKSKKKVEALQNDGNDAVKRIALAMVTQRDLADRHAQAVQQGDQEPEEAVLAFSQRFYGALGVSGS